MTDFMKAVAEAAARQQNRFTVTEILKQQMKEAGEIARMVYEQQTSAPEPLQNRLFGVKRA